MMRINRIEIEPGLIRGKRGYRERWTYRADELQDVYSSHLVNRIKPGRANPTRLYHYGELNLRRRDGRFVLVLAQGALDDKFPPLLLGEPTAFDENGAESQPSTEARLNTPPVVPLTPEIAQTPLQAAAIYVAHALRLPAWYDQRLK
jgi:hypothetical protein